MKFINGTGETDLNSLTKCDETAPQRLMCALSVEIERVVLSEDVKSLHFGVKLHQRVYFSHRSKLLIDIFVHN